MIDRLNIFGSPGGHMLGIGGSTTPYPVDGPGASDTLRRGGHQTAIPSW